MDIDSLRKDLITRRGKWSAIALQAGVNRKTVERIVYESAYMPNLRTMIALDAALKKLPATKQAA